MNKSKTIIGIFVLAALLLIAVVSIFASAFLKSMSLQDIKEVLESMGSMASVYFVMLCVLRGIVFVPCGLLSALGGMLYGRLLGTALTLIGFTAGSVITFYLSRVLGRDWVQHVLGEKYQSYENYISKDSFSRIFLMRVIPILPFDAVSCMSGVSGARVDRYILATLIGSLPGVFIYVSFGDSIRSMSIKRMAFSVILIALFVSLHFFYKYLAKVIRKVV